MVRQSGNHPRRVVTAGAQATPPNLGSGIDPVTSLFAVFAVFGVAVLAVRPAPWSSPTTATGWAVGGRWRPGSCS